jgi:hypothetical protein
VKIIHLFPNGQVEIGTGKPGYRWVPAYSLVAKWSNKDGSKPWWGTSQPLPRREWYAMAKRDGQKCKFYKTQEEARAAYEKELV